MLKALYKRPLGKKLALFGNLELKATFIIADEAANHPPSVYFKLASSCECGANVVSWDSGVARTLKPETRVIEVLPALVNCNCDVVYENRDIVEARLKCQS